MSVNMSTDEWVALGTAIACGYDFALIRDGHNGALQMICDDGSGRRPHSARRVTLCPWPCTEAYTINDIVSMDDLTATDRDGEGTPERPWPLTTARTEYLKRVGAVADRLRQNGGKVVLSRTIAGELDREPDFVIDDVLAGNPDTLRIAFYKKGLGLWVAATPELLLHADNRTIHSMALAGTRPLEANGPWDDKNLAEHGYVVDFITDKFRQAGLNPQTECPHELRTSTVEHLCTMISAPNYGFDADGRQHKLIADPLALAMELAPTPAVCGFPRDRALETIQATEGHPRRMYGGFVAVSDEEPAGDGNVWRTFTAHVMLRCAQLDLHNYCIYAGGGITALSDPAAEWDEAQAKAQTLLGSVQSLEFKV